MFLQEGKYSNGEDLESQYFRPEIERVALMNILIEALLMGVKSSEKPSEIILPFCFIPILHHEYFWTSICKGQHLLTNSLTLSSDF
jgi:hypothetical protein